MEDIDIAYIESPLQMFNLIEYTKANNLNINLLVLNKKTETSESNYTQIIRLIKFIDFKNKVEIDLEGEKKNLLKARFILKKLNLEKYAFKKVNAKMNIVTGEYRSLIFWMIVRYFKDRKVTVLDDGTATLRINRKTNLTPREFLKLIFYRLFSVQNKEKEPLIFYSVYNIKDKIARKDQLIVHNYSGFRGMLKEQNSNADTIFIIGSPLLEAGVVGGEDLEITISLIEKVKFDFPRFKLVYIPHRRERAEKLLALNNFIEIRALDFPFEVYPLIMKESTSIVAGFYSSLYDNLASIYNGEIKIIAYILPDSVIAKEWKAFVSSVYKNYGEENAGRIELRTI